MSDSYPRLFIPGPTNVEPEILAAMAHPMIGHRMKEYRELHGRVVAALRPLLETEQGVFLCSASSTGGMEAAIRNCVGSRVLSCVCGAFSDRWHRIALANGKEADRLDVPWGDPILPEGLDRALAGGDYDAVTLVLNETSTGLLNPIRELAEVVRRHPKVLLLVDAVSAFGGVRIPVDELGIDVLVGGLQKAMALPPGFSVLAVSDRALNRARSVPARGTYFDFVEFAERAVHDETPNTPSLPHIHALEARLAAIAREGIEARFARHAAMAECCRAWARRCFGLFPPERYASPTLTAVRNTRSIDVAGLNRTLRERHGVVISDGYGKIKGATFRIAHMGETRPEELEELLGWIDAALASGAASNSR